MPPAFGNLPFDVVLLGEDDEVHARGKLPLDLLMDCPLVSRNGRIYVLDVDMSAYRNSPFYYRERKTPYLITEF